LRLYLLKLLDEAPRHGYDVIRLLQDKFLGVYSPSPGTIYPRLARLEEEGLVTHETVDGKKVYRITEAGRAELNRRLDDLSDLEEELAASVRDIAKEISRDVRETVRNLRDELTWAVREAGRPGAPGSTGSGTGAPGTGAAGTAAAGNTAAGNTAADDAGPGSRAGSWADATSDPDVATGASSGASDPAKNDPAGGGSAGRGSAGDDSTGGGSAGRGSGRDSAGGGSARDGSAHRGSGGDGQGDGAGQGQERRGRGDWRDWAWPDRNDWRDWADWARRQSWTDWAAKQDRRDRTGASRSAWAQPGPSSRPDWLRAGQKERREGHADLASDLEHLAGVFAREIRGVAKQAETMGDDAVGSLGRILGDALSRIRTEVFRAPGDSTPRDDGSTARDPDSSSGDAGSTARDGDEADAAAPAQPSSDDR
jgi:DNA-binding PadR family transcriptional regulator